MMFLRSIATDVQADSTQTEHNAWSIVVQEPLLSDLSIIQVNVCQVVLLDKALIMEYVSNQIIIVLPTLSGEVLQDVRAVLLDN